MRHFEATIYPGNGSPSFRVQFQAEDSIEAAYRMIALYGEGKFDFLKEIYP